jgi:hypothetical protein
LLEGGCFVVILYFLRIWFSLPAENNSSQPRVFFFNIRSEAFRR